MGGKEPGVKETSFTEFWVLKGETRPSPKVVLTGIKAWMDTKNRIWGVTR